MPQANALSTTCGAAGRASSAGHVPPVRSSHRLERALGSLGRALSGLRAPWMVTGGIAAVAHGVQRLTTDIDVIIQGDAVSLGPLLSRLKRHRIVPRIDEPEAFAERNFVLLLRHAPTEVEIDLSLGWTAFDRAALGARASRRVAKLTLPTATVDDLIAYKIVGGRSQDIDDIVTLLRLYPDTELARIRKQVRKLVGEEARALSRRLDQRREIDYREHP